MHEAGTRRRPGRRAPRTLPSSAGRRPASRTPGEMPRPGSRPADEAPLGRDQSNTSAVIGGRLLLKAYRRRPAGPEPGPRAQRLPLGGGRVPGRPAAGRLGGGRDPRRRGRDRRDAPGVRRRRRRRLRADRGVPRGPRRGARQRVDGVGDRDRGRPRERWSPGSTRPSRRRRPTRSTSPRAPRPTTSSRPGGWRPTASSTSRSRPSRRSTRRRARSSSARRRRSPPACRASRPWRPRRSSCGSTPTSTSGQILVADDGYRVIDFEGEPIRPIEERRRPDSPLRDVASLLRSLDHVARSAPAAGGATGRRADRAARPRRRGLDRARRGPGSSTRTPPTCVAGSPITARPRPARRVRGREGVLRVRVRRHRAAVVAVGATRGHALAAGGATRHEGDGGPLRGAARGRARRSRRARGDAPRPRPRRSPTSRWACSHGRTGA